MQTDHISEMEFIMDGQIKTTLLSEHVSREKNVVTLRFQHHDVNGTIVNEEIFEND